MIIHDFAYSEIYYDGKRPMSIMEIPGARDVAVEMISCSKSYNMAGWRVGFIVGNKDMIAAVARLKSYMDYGIFSPIQVAAVMALDQGDAVAAENRKIYQARLDCLMEGFSRIGWELERPAGTMFCWARIPEKFREMKSMEFCKMVMTEAEVAFSPGIGFGSLGDEYVRIALVENEHRIRQATRNLKKIFKES